MDSRIEIEALNYVEELGFGGSFGELEEFAVNACLFSDQSTLE
jgi:hypothetical protein